MPKPTSAGRHRLLALLTTALVATSVSACDVPTPGVLDEPTEITESASGGVLTTMSLGPVQTWDPQRIASPSDAAFAGRVFARTLTAFQHGPDAAGQVTLTGDLATDTGEADQTLRVWTFTLRDGVKWQDGSDLTCEDVKYGISRSFATDVITGGPNYAIAYLDIPKTPEGQSIFQGPYVEDESADAGRAAFDKAVACDGPQLTIRLSEPVADFAGMVSTVGFAAYKQSEDTGPTGTYRVFSAGPYTLASAWMPDRGGTFVRNPHWSATSDPIRLALPDEIVYREGMEPQEVAQVIMADEEGAHGAVALDTAPPAIQEQIAAAEQLRERSVNSRNGLVDYLVPNFTSPVMGNSMLRSAFVLATDRDAYAEALGGATAAEPTTSVLASGVRANLDDPGQVPDPTGTSDPESAEDTTATASAGESAPGAGEGSDPASSGQTTQTADGTDVERAANLVAEAAAAAGLETPVPVRVAYRSSRTMDNAMRALEEGWTEAGFAIELQPIQDGYFATVSAAERAGITDVFWSNWAADWNSASTVLPALFDSRLNVSEVGSGATTDTSSTPTSTRR